MTLLAALTLALSALALSAQVSADDAHQYRDAALTCLDNLIEHGRDRYGPVHTPMFMSVIDIRTNTAPQHPETYDAELRTEGRLHRRNPAGCDLFDDQPLIRTLFAATELTQESRYADAAREYIASYLQRARKPNGLPVWGTHIYYDAFTDAPAGDQDGKGPHEILILAPQWQQMADVAPDDIQTIIEALWRWHVPDKKLGITNRHDDDRIGCDFAFFGAELAYAFAFLSKKTGDSQYLDWAKIVADRHWNARNPDTNLAPDAPSTGDRYDAHHTFTTLPGPHAALLLQAYEASGDAHFKDLALGHIRAYTKYAWDDAASRFHGMLTLDGTPLPEQERGPGYDIWKPTGYVDTWRTIMFSYEFPLIAAQTAVYAHELTQDPEALAAAKAWSRQIRADLPPKPGRRWRDDLYQALPGYEEIGGTRAENYGRAISFFLGMHRITDDNRDLATAKSLADEAIEKLYENGWFKGHPAKPYYETVDGVGFLLFALLELANYPEAIGQNL